jgi:hypothetical protein
MGLEHFTINKVENIVANGVKIRCKEEEHYIILMASLLMRVNGIKINSMVMEYSIIKHLFMLLKVLIGNN